MPPVSKSCRIAVIMMLSIALIGSQEGAGSVYESNTETFLRYLRPILKPLGGAARIYNAGTCNQKGKLSEFPLLNVQAPSAGIVGLPAVRQIFQNDKRVKVAQDRSGMIRIIIGEPPSPILQTRIRSIELLLDEPYMLWGAIWAIERSTEVKGAQNPGEDAWRKLGGDEVIVASIQIPVPDEESTPLPSRTPARMRDITLDEALDKVARAFGGIIIYNEWSGPHGALHSRIDYQPVVDYFP
jgi:hypothetical protein